VKPPEITTFGCSTSAACPTSRSRKRNSSPSFRPAASGIEVRRRSCAIDGTSFCVIGSSKNAMSIGSIRSASRAPERHVDRRDRVARVAGLPRGDLSQ
jgi:hypothetical protein